MSRRRRRENWGGDSDEDVDVGDGGSSVRRPMGLDSLLAKGATKAQMAAQAHLGARGPADDDGDEGLGGGGVGDEAGNVSSAAEDSGLDSESEEATAADAVNTKERKKPERRDAEKAYASRMKQQGISMDEGVDDDGEEEEKSYGTGGAPQSEEAIRRAKIKALFDKKKDEKYMSFAADDPLKPNANRRRAAEREDEELDEDDELSKKDPWLLQAAEDAQRSKHPGEDAERIMNRPPVQPSTAVFDKEEQAPIFDQFKARETLLKHMQPGETVMQTVKRLGVKPGGNNGSVGGSSTSSGGPQPPRTKMKNVRTKKKDTNMTDASSAGTPAAAPVDPEAEKARKQAFDEVTEAANGFLTSGYVEIYQDTYEKIFHLVQSERQRLAQAEQYRQAQARGAVNVAQSSASAAARAKAAARLQRKRAAREAGLPEPDSSSSSEEEEDIFASRPATSMASMPPLPSAAMPAASHSHAASSTSTSAALPSSSIAWMYKWSSSGEEKEQGPFSTEKMVEWQRRGFFDSDVVVRRMDHANNKWYNVTQMDFTQPDRLPQQQQTAASKATDGTVTAPLKKKFKF